MPEQDHGCLKCPPSCLLLPGKKKACITYTIHRRTYAFLHTTTPLYDHPYETYVPKHTCLKCATQYRNLTLAEHDTKSEKKKVVHGKQSWKKLKVCTRSFTLILTMLISRWMYSHCLFIFDVKYSLRWGSYIICQRMDLCKL